MARLDKFKAVASAVEGADKAVDAVAGIAKNSLDAPG
jgi:hypothetical protein